MVPTSRLDALKRTCSLPEEALLFLVVMGRFEYTLARLGYAQNAALGLAVDWDRFCNERYYETIHDVVLKRDIAPNFRQCPPMVAGLDQGELKFLHRRSSIHPRDLIQSLRNFKFALGALKFAGYSSSRVLTESALEAVAIIDVILECDPEVSDIFHSEN